MFKPKHGVPQGGITSPILFNFAMYFMLQKLLSKINENIPPLAHAIQTEDLGLWADDLLMILRFWDVAGPHLMKTICTSLTNIGQKWRPRVNWSKSAIIKFFGQKRSWKA